MTKYETLNLGTGQLVVIDNSGTTAQGRPVGILKDAKLTKSYELKELRDGSKQIAVDSAQTAKKITLSGKLGSIYANLVATLSPGASVTANGEDRYEETVAIGATVTPTKTVANVLYVLDKSGLPMTQVASGDSPTTGQFKLSAGNFAFNATDVSGGGNVTLVYTWSDALLKTIAEGQASIGQQTPIGLFLSSKYTDTAGTVHRLNLRAYAAKPSKLDVSFKNEDFTEYDFEATLSADSNGDCIKTYASK